MMFRANLANISFRANRFAEAGGRIAQGSAGSRQGNYARNANASEVRQAAAVAVTNASGKCLFLALWVLKMTSPAGIVRPPNPGKIIALAQQVRSRNFDRWLALSNSALESDAGEPHQMVHALIEAEISVEEAAAQAGESLSTPLQSIQRASEALASGYPAVWKTRLTDERKPGLEEAVNCLTGNAVVLDLNPVQSGIICISCREEREG